MPELPESFEGIGPDGKPATFRFAKGRLYANRCTACRRTNGGGVHTEDHNPYERARTDPYSIVNRPCIWCESGPVVIEYLEN